MKFVLFNANFPVYIVMAVDKYIGPLCDQSQPKQIPIPSVNWSKKKQISLKISWALTIHKSKGFTLTRSIINIGNIEHQGLTFTAMSLTTALEKMWIAALFSFNHYAKMKHTSYVTLWKKEESRLHSLSLIYLKLQPSIRAHPLPNENTNVNCQYNWSQTL